jgi:hypothetical protein
MPGLDGRGFTSIMGTFNGVKTRAGTEHLVRAKKMGWRIEIKRVCCQSVAGMMS